MTDRKAMNKFEQERLFGDSIDIFKSYYAVKFLHNLLKNIGVREIKDNDFYRSLATYITGDEVSEIYDSILPKKKREELSESRNFRNPPEIGEDDTDDCLSYLGKNISRRKKMWNKLEEVYAIREKDFEECLKKKNRYVSAVEKRFLEMKELFNLSQTEMEILLAIFFSATSYLELGDFSPGRFQQGEKISVIAKTVGKLDVEVAELLNEKNNIGKFQLVDEDCDLDRTFLSYLSGISSKALSEKFWNKYDGEVLPWKFHGKLAEKYGMVLKRMIKAKTPDTGISVLLFGVAGSGKTSFAASLAKDMGKELYFIAQNDDDNKRMSYSPAFRYAALAVAQKQLDPDKCILVVDECDKMVENCSLGGGFLSILGIEPAGGRDGESKGQLNSVIDQNRHTVLWICNSKQNAIDPSSRRRFDYSIFFDELSPGMRKYIWENALKFNNCEGKLSEEFIQRISSRYPVNPGGISVAVKNAALLCRQDSSADFAKEVMTFLKAHCSLLGIQESPSDKLEPARDYSLEGLNIKSGIKLPRLIEVCKKFLKNMDSCSEDRDQPRMNLLLFGVPGAGKTEFAKYLAKQVDKPLCVKNASDLLNMYVGGTEQRIAAAFAEAEANGEILFIDEGDSLLGSREGATKSWEVSQVNTLLSEMERFRGIFSVGTNLIQRLDQAALRRFSFRLHFDYLTNEGKEIFYKTYFKPLNMPDLTESEKKSLHDIDQMTPSDFRNTRQQFCYLEDSNLTNSEIIEALAAEVVSKTCGSNYTGLGKIANRMGF